MIAREHWATTMRLSLRSLTETKGNHHARRLRLYLPARRAVHAARSMATGTAAASGCRHPKGTMMPCLPCQAQRAALVTAARRLDIRGVAAAITTAATINADKLRGMTQAEINAKYGAPTRPATPYRRPGRTV